MRGYGLAVDSGPSAARAQEARLERAIRDAIRRKDFATAERLQRQLDIARRASQGRTVYPKAQGRTVYPTLPNALQSLVQRLKATFPPPASTLPAPGALTPSAATPMPTPEAVPAVPSEEATDIVDSSEGVMGYWNSLSTTTKVAVGAGALVGVYALFLRR